MAPCAAKLTTKSMPTWLCVLSWGAKHMRLCARSGALSWLLLGQAAGVEMHSQMGADLPLRAVLGVSCCPAPLNGTRNGALSWALLGPSALSCTAERSKTRADPALRIVLGIPAAADVAPRLQIDHEIQADLAPRAVWGRKTHAPLRAERAPLRTPLRAVLAALRTAGVEMHSQRVPTCLCALSWECLAALRRQMDREMRASGRCLGCYWGRQCCPAPPAEPSEMRTDLVLRIVLGIPGTAC